MKIHAIRTSIPLDQCHYKRVIAVGLAPERDIFDEIRDLTEDCGLFAFAAPVRARRHANFTPEGACEMRALGKAHRQRNLGDRQIAVL
jgi:hypothetical protein